ncbi:MAG: B3/B4 domain-containing protein [Solirubrobacteraceae bacterium]
MTAQLEIAPEIFQAFPLYQAAIVDAKGLKNGPSDPASSEYLRAAAKAACDRLDGAPPASHPHVAAWRAAYSQFGSKPSRYPCSAEALLKRALSGTVPTRNRLVDVYNAVSLRYVLPVGGEDSDHLKGTLWLKLAEGTETFEMASSDGGEFVSVTAGEPIWVDGYGVTCRRWNWRQAPRTALREDTRNAFFVLDALDDEAYARLDPATEELIAQLRTVSPSCDIDVARYSALVPKRCP